MAAYTKDYPYGADIVAIEVGNTKVSAVLPPTDDAVAINKYINTSTPGFFVTDSILKKFIGAKEIPADKPNDRTYQVVIAYLGIKYCLSKLNATTPSPPEPAKYLQAIGILLQHLATKLQRQQGGKKRKQKGGMDTAKIYNAQGLVQELSALNQTDTATPALLFPSPFSASNTAVPIGDALPSAAAASIMPPISTPLAGGKKKVKYARKIKH